MRLRGRLGASGAAAIALFALARPAAAQAPAPAPEKIAVGDFQLSPSLEVRLRGEYRHDAPDLGGRDFFGLQTPRVRSAWLVMERSRLGLGVERGAVRAQLTLQDARALGDPSPTARLSRVRGLGELAPYEAYGEVRGTSARPNYVRFGRQAVVWGEGRLVGNADFSPKGRSLDAVRGHVAAGNFDFEALASILEAPSPLGSAFESRSGPATSGVQLYGLMARWTLDPLLRVEAFGLARISRSGGAFLDGSRFELARASGDLVTAALRVSGDGKGWSYGAEGAYQAGNAARVGFGGADVSAWAAAAHVAKTFDQLLVSPTLRVAGSYASGDDGRGAYKQFDPLLPDPQRFHGQMDLFSWSNMMDVAGRVSIVPFTDATVAAEYRYARLAQGRGEWIGGYMNAIGSSSTPPYVATFPAVPATSPNEAELGHEVALAVSWRPWVPFELRAGWSGLLLGDGAKAIMRAHARTGTDAPSLTQYAYLQATVTVP